MDDKNVKKLKIPGFVSKLGIVFVLIALVILWSCLSSAFFTVNNMLLIVKQVSMYSILCVGMTFVLITGGIDLSVGSIVALAAVFAAHYCSGDYLETPLICSNCYCSFYWIGMWVDKRYMHCLWKYSTIYYDNVYDVGSQRGSICVYKCKSNFQFKS